MSFISQFFILCSLAFLLLDKNSLVFAQKCSEIIPYFPKYFCREEKPIGKGATGTSWVVLKSGISYILKAQEAGVGESSGAKTDLRFLNLFKGDNHIIQLIEAKFENGFLFEILEFGSKGSLMASYNREREFFRDPKNTLSLFQKILAGVEIMHRKGVVHADLKLENIVLDRNNDPKIIDFDLSVAKDSLNWGRGTVDYMDPVILGNWGKNTKTLFSEFRDVYSLGVMLFYLSQDRFPFRALNRFDALENIKKNKYVFSKGTDYDIVMIAHSCLILDETKRKGLNEIIEMTELAISEHERIALTADLVASNVNSLPGWLMARKDPSGVFSGKDIVLWILLGFCLIALLTAAVFFSWPFVRKSWHKSLAQTSDQISDSGMT